MFTHCKTLSCMVIKFRKLWLWNMNKYIFDPPTVWFLHLICTIGNQWEGNLGRNHAHVNRLAEVGGDQNQHEPPSNP